MKIVQFTAENVKKLKLVDITPTKDFIQITGKNGSGKTSVIDAIWWALVGGKAIQGEPIRQGEEKAIIKLDLGEMKVTRRFSKGGTSLVVENADGFRANKPQELLDALVGHLTFDPLEFSRMKAREQFDVIREIAQVEVDIDALAAKDTADMEKRRDINRDIKTLEGQAAGIAVDEGAPDEELSAAALLAAFNEVENQNAAVLAKKEQVAGLWRESENYETLITKAEEQIKELKLDIDHYRERRDVCRASSENIHPGEIRSTDDIKAKIADSDAINTAVRAKKKKSELNASIALKQKASDALTEAMEARKAEVSEAMANAKMPFQGLELGQGEVKLNGVPLLQLSSAEQLMVSCAIAMQSNPKLRIIRIKDGSLLDDESLKIVQQAAADKDYQVWVERVDTSGKIGIVMEDGEVAVVNEGDA